jgi:hypothetical protein
MTEGSGFFALKLMLVRAGRAVASDGPTDRLSGFNRRSGCVPAEPYPPLKQPISLQNQSTFAIGQQHYSTFDRTTTQVLLNTTEPLCKTK